MPGLFSVCAAIAGAGAGFSGCGAAVEAYYRDSVIGGPGAFLIVAEDFNAFGDAVRRKMVQEIAGLTPAGQGQPPGWLPG